MSSPGNRPKTVLVTGANGYIGNAIAHAFVRSGWTTYGLVRKASFLSSLAAEEIIPLLGSPSDISFLSDLDSSGVVFDVIVSTTEQIANYFPHYHEVVALLRAIARRSTEKRPLVLFTSGCKDYGMSPFVATSPKRRPHTELSPLNPPTFALDRANGAIQIFHHDDLFDAVLLRPTNVYGLSSSFYGLFFKEAEVAKSKGIWKIGEDKDTILHAMHVDDCAEAYVALAECERSLVKGQVYNISASEYETLDDIVQALVKEYGIAGGVQYGSSQEIDGSPDTELRELLMGFSQWVDSAKLRRDVGWTDTRQLFSKGIRQYRLAYEAAIERGGGVLQEVFKHADKA